MNRAPRLIRFTKAAASRRGRAISTNVGGAAEYIVPGQGGALVTTGDEAALAGAIEDWLRDAARRRAAGAFNRQRVVQQFTWRASAARLLEVYQTVIAGRRAVQVPA